MNWWLSFTEKFKLLRACTEELSLLREENIALKVLLEEQEKLFQEQQLLFEKTLARHKETSITDALTGAFNRRYLDANIVTFFSNQERNEKCLAIFYMDLDNFKAVNDTCGHAAGDEVLIRTTTILQEIVRDSDTVIRLGGDEFIIIATNVSNKDTLQSLSKRLQHGIASMKIEDCDIKVSLSIGICFVEKDENNRLKLTPEKALKLADEAMYISKKGGRNRTTFV